MIIEIPSKRTHEIIEFNKDIPKLCCSKYPKHPNGCPNYGQRDTCPPGLPLINEILNFNQSIYLIYTEFPLGKFVDKMITNHPKLKTIGQQYNLRYWQPVARKIQREEEAKAKESHYLDKIIQCAEGHGVNLDQTMKNMGIELNWNYPPAEHDPGYTRFLISIGGYDK